MGWIPMTDIERSAAFYLGKEYDLQKGETLDRPVMYDARDLTTHAVCIGMTGSGKTGLAVDLLEEAALDGIPSIVIDPKGDMTNLLLTFPDLLPADFEPWVNIDDARRKGQTISEYASTIAATWKDGLAQWDEDGERIRRLKESAEFVIYTPGSDAGVPVSVLQTFAAPGLDWDDEGESIRELIAGTVSGLLGLIGVDADPVRSREHILLSTIFEYYWRQGRDLDLTGVIEAIQKPPVQKMGVFDVDTFFPAQDRFELAMALNNVIASPSFSSWIQGVPLDIGNIVRTPSGRPRVAIFYIAHLTDEERLFFVTLLLQQVLGWIRRLSGTTSLRCLLYFDEVFGYFPPYPANPPTKRPLLTLLKIARAFGVGLVLTTQNPVDLDYKGLTNAGTWFIGKLQTDRDKARVLEGMEGVVAESGTMLDRAYLDRLISSVGSRVFILHNVHEERPLLFRTRWAMSYLRGPLTRSQVRQVMAPYTASQVSATDTPLGVGTTVGATAVADVNERASVAEPAPRIPDNYTPIAPPVNGRVAQYFLPVQVAQAQALRQIKAQVRAPIDGEHLVYEPHLLGVVSALYEDGDRGRPMSQRITCLTPLPEAHGFVDWEAASQLSVDMEDLSGRAEAEALYGDLPEDMTNSPPYTRLRDALVDYVYREKYVPAWEHAQLKLRSEIGESERDFQMRCQEAARQRRDAEIDALKKKQARAIDQLEAKLAREERELEDDRIDFQGRKQEELLSAGESVVSLLLGRSRSVRGLSQASRRRRMTRQAKADLAESEETIEALEEELDELRKQHGQDLEAVRNRWAEAGTEVQEISRRPKKSNIRVEVFGLAWVPHWLYVHDANGGRAEQSRAPAYQLT